MYTYNPKAGLARLESGRTNKLLMRRYAVVQKARDADVIGILVGTLGVGVSLSPPSQFPRSHLTSPTSKLPPAHHTPAHAHRARTQEVVHDQRRENQPREAR